MKRTKLGILLIFLSGLMFSSPTDQGLFGNKPSIFIPDCRSVISEPNAEVFDKYYFLTNRKDQVIAMQKIHPITIMEQGITALEDTIQEDTTISKKEEISETEFSSHTFWQRLGFGIGYNGGLCYTGIDLMKRSTDWDPLAFLDPTNYLYWLNSIEVSFFYHLSKKSGIEVGGGYGWAEIEKHSTLSYQFELYPLWLGSFLNKHTIKISYIYARSTKITKGEKISHYYGKGGGLKISYVYHVNRLLALNLNLGQISYMILQNNVEHKIDQCLNGSGLSIGYNF